MGFWNVLESIKSCFWDDSPQTENTQEESRPLSYAEAGMEAFRNDNWELMDEDEKIESLQQLSDDYSAEIGLSDPPTVVSQNLNGCYGKYSYSTNTISIDLSECSKSYGYINPYEAVDTTIHEANHAYQHESVDSSLENESKYSEGEKAVLSAERTKAGYIKDGEENELQSIELDSNNAGLQYVSSHCDGMTDDPAYFDYMNSRDNHFERVNTRLRNTEDMNAQEAGQIQAAYEAGVISEDEANLANEAIVQGNTTFRTSSYESGEIAHQECIDASITKSKQLHNDFENGTSVQAEDRRTCIGYMQEGLAQSQEELNTLKAERSEYISSNNMGFRAVAADEKCQEYQAKIEACEHDIGQFNYHITELSTDLELSQQGGLSQGSEGLVSGLGESAGSEMDNGLSM